jgi:hypothetical protein
MPINILNACTQRKHPCHDFRGNPYPTNLKKHLSLAQQMDEEDAGVLVPAQRIVGGMVAVGVLYLAFTIGMPLLIGGAS